MIKCLDWQFIFKSLIIMKENPLSKQTACRLYQTFEEISFPGSVVIRYHEDRKAMIEGQDVAFFLHDQVSAADDHIGMLVASGKTLGLKVSQENTLSFSQFQEYFKACIAPLVKKSQNHKRYVKFISLEWKSNTDHEILLSILRFLQQKEFCIVMQPQISSQSWGEYQKELANFTSLLQNQNLLLSTISILMKLPAIPSQHYAKQILSIWRRVIPAEVGRLVIQDEDDERNKIVGELFYVKDMPVCWQLQFITSDSQKFDNLVELSLGLT